MGGGWPASRAPSPCSCTWPNAQERPPVYGLDHRMPVGSESFVNSIEGATGTPFVGRQPRHRPEQRRRVLSRDARRRSAARSARSRSRPTSTGPATSGCAFARALAERAQARRAGEDPARRRRLGHDRQRDPRDPRGRRLPARVVQPDPLVHHRPLQPPHAPQVAHRRRPRRLHRRRRHRGPLARPRAGSRPLARHAGPHRGARRRAPADRLRRELARDHRRTA